MTTQATATETANGRSHSHRGTLVLRGVVWGAIFGILLSLLLIFELLPVGQVELQVGQVSPADIRAPRQITFVSQVLTEKARAQAEQAVRDVYDPPDPKIGRQQTLLLRQILDFIGSVRADPYASDAEKIRALTSISDLALSEDLANLILSFSDAEWETTQVEAERVLDSVMREAIRPSDVNEVRSRIPALVRLTLTETQTQAVVAFVQNLVKANSFLNARETQNARLQARENVEPVAMTVAQGQTIVREGDLVEPLDMEILEALGLLRPQIKWQDVLGNALLAALITVLLGIYLSVRAPDLWNEQSSLLATSVLFLGFTATARMMVPGHTVLPYLFPGAAMGLIISTLFDTQAALFSSVLLSVLVGAIGGGNLELAVYVFAGSVVAILAIQRVERLNVFVFAGMLATLANWLTILAFRLPGQRYDWVGLATLFGAGLLNGGLASMIALLGYLALGNLLDIPTTLRLVDLARPTHPLMRQLLLKAPGTYHHSILVSNLAEEAAERVGANPILARVGAYYHDIGKTLRPYFFVDNQTDGQNIHDRLDPETSAHIIVSHVKDGIDLARKYGLPRRIVDFIAEHHGTMLATYFYERARESAGADNPNPDPARFRYPGPKPRSKETAILMLADACEAAVRSLRPATAEEIETIVHKIIAERMESGQLADSDLTLRDLNEIQNAFTTTLQGVFHPRIRYPGQEQKGRNENDR
ncbi:MAG: HDIG domain-containing protein [Chloroflexi bacterium]|nr:HDIG domain-containing protein [Chloroflexota bacterium]